ncbi:MAG: hypothetical protein U0228_09065 [Myxococcaceae bacterium]
MGKILTLVLGLCIVAFLAYKQMYRHTAPGAASAPKERLENVQNAANRIEQDSVKRAQENEKKADIEP